MSTAVQITGALNKTELSEAVAAELGISHEAGAKALTAVLDVITRTVTAGHPVTVTNFGTWLPVQKAPRRARNPQTGETVTVPAQQTIRFRISPRLREVVRGADPTASIRKRPSTST